MNDSMIRHRDPVTGESYDELQNAVAIFADLLILDDDEAEEEGIGEAGPHPLVISSVIRALISDPQNKGSALDVIGDFAFDDVDVDGDIEEEDAELLPGDREAAFTLVARDLALIAEEFRSYGPELFRVGPAEDSSDSPNSSTAILLASRPELHRKVAEPRAHEEGEPVQATPEIVTSILNELANIEMWLFVSEHVDQLVADHDGARGMVRDVAQEWLLRLALSIEQPFAIRAMENRAV